MGHTCHSGVYAQVLAAAETQGQDRWWGGAQILGSIVNELLQAHKVWWDTAGQPNNV